MSVNHASSTWDPSLFQNSNFSGSIRKCITPGDQFHRFMLSGTEFIYLKIVRHIEQSEFFRGLVTSAETVWNKKWRIFG